MIQFYALGGIAATVDGTERALGGSRQRRLLAMLLIHRNTVVSVDRLAEAVFASEPTAAASTTLRSYIARIRRVLDSPDGPSIVVTQAPGYLLRVSPEAFDVAVFDRLVADAAVLLGRGDATAAAPILREALGLWRGDAYAEFADEEWALSEAQRLTELRLVAHERLVEAELAGGRASEVIPAIEALVREHPLREAFRAQLMTALYRAGRQADALRVFQELRGALVEELGLEPSPALSELEARVLNHDPALLLDEPAGLPLRGYRLGERLGTGRSGTVFAARLVGVEREFAVRVIRAEVADSPAFVRSFEATAHRVASLRHPAIVPIHDYWREPGAAYVVMRRVHGGTLADRLERGPLDRTVLLRVLGRIGSALVAAAEAGVTHGHVTPESVLFDDGGEPFLSDFALTPDDERACDDCRDFALLVQACLPAAADGSTAVLDTLARHDSTSIAELVVALTTALTGEEPSGADLPPNPYKGLRAFDEADAADFFGRDDLLEEMLGRLSHDDLRGRLLLVVGGSGTGKSSAVRAGLLPRVRAGRAPGSDRWLVTTMLPGGSPFKELAESLRRVATGDTSRLANELAREGGIDRVVRGLARDGDVLLVVDQFEELFTMAFEQDQRAFLRGILHAVSAPDSRLRVVATLRADFYDRPLAVQPFGAAVGDATVTIPAMLPSELEAAIVEPAARVGASIEQGLVTELVSAVADQPAALPSLQFALYELAERSPTRRLTRAAYRELGGVDGAIASRAEALYSMSDDPERATVRRMFERLVAVAAEGEPTRRRAARTELSSASGEGSTDEVIDRWVEARLLTLDRHPQTRAPTVEVAHEALLREWPRLRGWIEGDREALMALGRLRDAAASWEELGRDQGALYRGARLEGVLDVTSERADRLPALEREFINASVEEREREASDALDRVARQARANRRLRLQLAAIAVALVVALAGGFVAVDQRGEARQERQRATARELAAAAEASLDDDPERSILLALAAIDAAGNDVPPEAVEALHHAVTASRVVMTVPGVGGAVDWSADGTTFVTEGPENTGLVDLRDATTGKSIRSFHGHDVDLNGVAFSADGTMLATTGDDGALRVWDPMTGRLVLEHVDPAYEPDSGQPLKVTGPSFSGDGSLVAAGFWDSVRVIDVATGEVVREVPAIDASGTAISPDGRTVAIGSFHDVVRVVGIRSGLETARLGSEDGDNFAWQVAWSPDGRWITTVGDDMTVKLWDAAAGVLAFSGSGHGASVNGVDWAPDGARLATTSTDGTAIVWELTDGGLRTVLELSARGRGQGLWGVAFSPDGTRLMTGDGSITATTVWDIGASGGAEWPNLPAFPWSGVDFTADGELVWTRDGATLQVTNVATGELIETLGPPTDEDAAEIGPVDVIRGGDAVAASYWDGPIAVWDLGSSRRAVTFQLSGQSPGFSWSADGERVAVGTDREDVVVVLDPDGETIASVREHARQRITSFSLSPDGSRLATTREGQDRVDPADMPVTIWDLASGEVVSTIDTAAANVEFAPTGDLLVSSRRVENVADVWDAVSGERVATISSPAPIDWLTFSPDGTSLASAHPDGTLRIWDPRTGVLGLTLGGDGGPIVAMAFSPDGTKLATNGGDGIARVWALDLGDLIAIATDRLTRGFTDDECRQYLHVPRCPAG